MRARVVQRSVDPLGERRVEREQRDGKCTFYFIGAAYLKSVQEEDEETWRNRRKRRGRERTR